MNTNETESRQESTYQTGNINPPKSHQGLIAVLLILVVFLGGIVSALSMMNIRLFHLLEQNSVATDDISVAFSREKQAQPEVTPGVELTALGVVGQEVTAMYRSYYGWPTGLYISQLIPEGPAAQAGLLTGDILVAMNGAAITGEESMQQTLRGLTPGRKVQLRVFRGGRQFTVTLNTR